MKADEKKRAVSRAYNLTKNKDYDIIPIESFKEASEFSKYVSWCVTHDEDAFYRYTKNGTNRFYFCIRKDYKTVRKENGNPDDPLDDYGLSMMAILIDDDGSMDSSDGCTLRWNKRRKEAQAGAGSGHSRSRFLQDVQTVFGGRAYVQV